jgi:hypothetical protein
MTTGCSGTPLPAELGVKPGSRVLLDGSPEGFALDEVTVHGTPTRPPYDVAVLFAPDRQRSVRRWPPLDENSASTGWRTAGST